MLNYYNIEKSALSMAGLYPWVFAGFGMSGPNGLYL